MTAAQQGDLFARVMAIKEKAMQNKERQALIDAEAEQAKAKAEAAKVIKLPIWPEAVRAVPNGFLRSALFGAIAKGKRRYMEGEQLAALDGVEVCYTGQRLDQGDLDVWESVLHSVRDQNLGSQCRITSYALLKLMGKTDTGKNRETLHKRIVRLRSGTVELKQGRHVYIGGLIDEAFKDEETQEWVIELNPKLRALYGADQFTQVDWSVRHALDGKPLAQWLHGFYASHAKPYPIKIETLHRLCGSDSELRRYRQTLHEALSSVTEACSVHGEAFSYQVVDGLVDVEKKPSKAQSKHLTRKKP